MSSLLKSTVLSLGILAGTAAVALAQSVTALPPSSPPTAPAVATPSAATYRLHKWKLTALQLPEPLEGCSAAAP